MSISFATYYGGIIYIGVDKDDDAISNETWFPSLYSYVDSETGLTFIKISKTYLFCLDTDYPICKSIVDNLWKIFYDPNYNSLENIKFIAQADNPSDATKWKNINDVLGIYNYVGNLPLTSYQNVYMKVIQIKTNSIPNYFPGTLFNPAQPYLSLKHVPEISEYTVPFRQEYKIRYNTVVSRTQPEGADAGNAPIEYIHVVPNSGTIRLGLPGRYFISCSVGLDLPANTLTSPEAIQIYYKINGVVKKRNYGWLFNINNFIQGNAHLVDEFQIIETDLTTNSKANLEIFVYSYWNGSSVNLTRDEITTCCISYRG